MKIKKLFNFKSAIIFLLSLILITLFLGFSNPLGFQVWYLLNRPQFKTVYRTEKYPCQKEISNPEYKEKRKEIFEKCWEESKKETGYGRARLAIPCRHEELGKLQLPQTITVESVCEKSIPETWFFVFGRKIFKNNNSAE